MEVRVLGPLEVVADDGTVAVLPGRQQGLLAALIVGAGAVCSSDSLIEAIWGESPPGSASKVLQVYVSRLRKALPGMEIRTVVAGYALELEQGSLDAARFERLLAEARAALQDGNEPLAVSLLDRGLSLWRGNAYGKLAYEDFARAEAERLEELRLLAVEERLEAHLRLGRHAELLPQLSSLAADHPLRERLQAQLMLGLYRAGRQTEALEAFTSTRSGLHELGLEPGAELRQLQRRILEHDPDLGAPARAEDPPAVVPSPPNALLGRERELRELRELLLREDTRLVVLTGAGGSGKTRLALEVARQSAGSFANGAALVELAPLRDPARVLGTISAALGAHQRAGDALETLAAELRPRELLLVLDNAEHLRSAAPLYVELLARVPRLTLLVTSRAVLHLSGEHVYPLEPLAVETAVALFRERAREAEPRFHPDANDEQAIRRICERLDGLPLAIELAAGRIRTLTPVELLARLDPRLPLLTGGPRDLPARQQTLRATLEWSYDLLDQDERRDLRRLAVFAGGCTLEAAEAVCGTTVERLTTLVDNNLLHRMTTPSGSRYTMLETIREFALERLEASGEAEPIGRRQLEFLIALAEPANLFAEAEGPQRHELVIPEQDNARAAIAWALKAGAVGLALQLAVMLENFWTTHDPFEGMSVFGQLLEADPGVPPLLRARALRAFAGSAHWAEELDRAEALYEQSLALHRALADELGSAIIRYRLSQIALGRGDVERARELLEGARASFRSLGSRRGEAQAVGSLGSLARAEGDSELAATLFEQSAEMCAKLGRRWWQATMLSNLAELALEGDRRDEAARRAAEALALSRQIADRKGTIRALAQFAQATAGDDPYRAGRLWGAVEAEEERGRVAGWKSERKDFLERAPAHAAAELEAGLQEGRELSLATAIAEAAAGRHSGSSAWRN